jgi:hypothetical protein
MSSMMKYVQQQCSCRPRTAKFSAEAGRKAIESLAASNVPLDGLSARVTRNGRKSGRHHTVLAVIGPEVGVLDAVVARAASGAVVEFRSAGSSMMPLIRSRKLMRVGPVDAAEFEG